MLKIDQIKLPITQTAYSGEDEKNELKKKMAKQLRIAPDEILCPKILKRSLDARKKPQLFWVYSVCFQCKNPVLEQKLLKRPNSILTEYVLPSYELTAQGSEKMKIPPVIVGMGPAGLFAGYVLARAGFCPIIYERGRRVEERAADVERFWENGKLLLHSNVQFGEGGAGTFSDGKLNTLIKDKTGRNREVLRIFVENGAPEHILYDAKPHIGTDILIKIVANMREKMLEWGSRIHYESTVTDFEIQDNRLTGLVINDKEKIKTETAILAIGHSARDTFQVLYDKKIPMEAKDFAVGLRIQHPQEMIDCSQYGAENKGYTLPAASYKLTAKTKEGRGVYSFCMCPGGYVVNASSMQKLLAVNGMSYSGRNSGVANSAIIVSVTKEDFENGHPLSGVHFQEELERKAYEAGNGSIPVQYYGDFAMRPGKRTMIRKPFLPQIKGAYVFSDLRSLFPPSVRNAFLEGMETFGKTIPGFDDDLSILAGVESRTSSPVRIRRNSQCESDICGLYPCGEGAGYAGGIMSAAMDGLSVAERIAKKYCI